MCLGVPVRPVGFRDPICVGCFYVAATLRITGDGLTSTNLNQFTLAMSVQFGPTGGVVVPQRGYGEYRVVARRFSTGNSGTGFGRGSDPAGRHPGAQSRAGRVLLDYFDGRGLLTG
jgi:hypothetical protein